MKVSRRDKEGQDDLGGLNARGAWFGAGTADRACIYSCLELLLRDSTRRFEDKHRSSRNSSTRIHGSSTTCPENGTNRLVRYTSPMLRHYLQLGRENLGKCISQLFYYFHIILLFFYFIVFLLYILLYIFIYFLSICLKQIIFAIEMIYNFESKVIKIL